MWSQTKPDKDGIWLWRFPRNNKESEYHQSILGVVVLLNGKIKDHDRMYSSDVWYGISPVETLYVDGA